MYYIRENYQDMAPRKRSKEFWRNQIIHNIIVQKQCSIPHWDNVYFNRRKVEDIVGIVNEAPHRISAFIIKSECNTYSVSLEYIWGSNPGWNASNFFEGISETDKLQRVHPYTNETRRPQHPRYLEPSDFNNSVYQDFRANKKCFFSFYHDDLYSGINTIIDVIVKKLDENPPVLCFEYLESDFPSLWMSVNSRR